MDNEIAIRWFLGFLFFGVGFVLWMVRYGFQGWLYNEKAKMRFFPFVLLIVLIILTFFIFPPR